MLPRSATRSNCCAARRNSQPLAAWLDAIPGVAGHGLFGPDLIADVIVGQPAGATGAAGATDQ